MKKIRKYNRRVFVVFSTVLVIFGIALIVIPKFASVNVGASPNAGQPLTPQQDDKRSLRERLDDLSPEKRQKAIADLNGAPLDTVDESLKFDDDGNLYFVCFVDEVAKMQAAEEKATPGADSAGETFPLAALPLLHSRPGSSKVLHLDFDGEVITGTAWNNSLGRASIPAIAFDTDGDPSTFSNGEITAVQNVWRRIAEDYAPFDVDVTTEQPTTFTPTTARILITRNTDANGAPNPSSSAGGVAYVNVFGRSDFAFYSPAWVYSNNLGGGREDYVTEAASHEAGHNLGLSHDGTSTLGYYNGHGTGNVSWAPIMGTGYNRNVSQWSKGEYPDANNQQDDLLIISNKTGYRPDDHGNDRPTASSLNVSGSNVSGSGVIDRTSDVDVFSFSTTGGAVNIRVQPFLATSNTRGGNLDAKVELLSSDGSVVTTNDPANQTYADIITTVGAGTFYLRIDGVGAGDLVTGYSDYASLGQYTISGTAVGVLPNSSPQFDFDGDGRSDVSIFRPSNGVWYLQQSSAGFTAVSFGAATDRLAPADYDGDGKTDPAIFRNGTWYLQRSQLGFLGISFGVSGDVPQSADFDGDGKAELAVFRPSNGTWYTFNLANNQSGATSFGTSSDKPVASDYDGDGKADYAVYRPSEGAWYLLRSAQGFVVVPFGIASDRPVPADYDGDGKTDVAVFRNGSWYLLRSQAGFLGVGFGLGTDVPAPADYDGDGQADIAVFRDGAWYLQRSSAGFTGVSFGTAGDKPVPAAFVP